MKITNKLTLSHLKENKSRSVTTVLGICVSVAMITAVFVAIASFLNLFGDVELMGGGNKHALLEVNQTQLQELKEDSRIDVVGISPGLEYPSYQIEHRKSDSKGTGDFYCGDEINLKQMLTGEYDGSIPKNKNEIAVEESFIEDNNLDWKIGDTVSIPIGTRTLFDEELNQNVTMGGSYVAGEEFEIRNIEQYKITAILHNNPATLAYNILCGYNISELNLKGKDTVTASVALKEVNHKSLDEINSIIKKYDIKNYDINKHYLETKFAIDEESSLATSIFPIAAIVLLIIMIASVVLIYNAFGMSLSERVRYLGMLASVGATKRQKKESVYFEGLVLGAIGIPVGILAGIAGIGITLKSVGAKIISTGMITGVSDSNMDMKVVVPLWVIAATVLFSALTIFISSFIPARKASSITPIDAISQRNEIKIKAKKLRTPKIIRKIFGYEGEIAYKNLKRNGRKSRVIVASIALSVVLFLSCNYFCQIFQQAIDMEVDVPYQVQTLVNYREREAYKKELDKIAGVDNYYCVNCTYYELSDKADQEDVDQSIRNKNFLTGTYKSLFNSTQILFINLIDDDDFNELCKANSIDYKDYYKKDTVKGLLMNNISHKNNGSNVFNDKVIGTKVSNGEIVISDFVKYDNNNYVCNLNPKNNISVYVPINHYYSVMEKQGKIENIDEMIYMIGIETDKHSEVTEDIYEMLDEKGYKNTSVQDYVESFQMMNTLTFVLEVFIYGFIALITLVTIANIINTISTGIAMRRKEFAMLKSVGTTPKGFRKIVSLESVFYGLKAIVFSIPISVLISFGMNKVLGSSMVPFELNWILYAAVILVVFAIVGLTMSYAVSKLKNDSIIETLKEDMN